MAWLRQLCSMADCVAAWMKCETMKGEKWDGVLVCASNLVSGYKLFIILIHILYTYIYI